MSKISISLIALLAAIACFGLGYRAGFVPPRLEQYRPLAARVPASELSGTAVEVRSALEIADPIERIVAIASTLKGLGAEAIPAVRDGYESVFLDLGASELRLLAQWWTRLEPRSAFQWAQSNFLGSSVLTDVVRAWAARDPQPAVLALRTMRPNPFVYRKCIRSLVEGWDESGQPGLGEFLQEMGRGAERQRVLGVIARRRVLRDGVDQATEWAESLPEDRGIRLKLQAYRRVASAIASLDGEQGARWAEEHGEGKYGSGVYRRVATRWGERDGVAAMNWLSTLPAGSNRDAAVRETFRQWSSRQRGAATAWLAETGPAPWNEPARALRWMFVSRTEPRQAIAQVELFADPTLREETLTQIARGWFSRDPEQARAWIEASELSDATKARALRPRKPRGRRSRNSELDESEDD